MHRTNTTKLPAQIEVAVIGGGQAGLAAAYYLKSADIPFIVLDANSRVGDPWRQRWDSLELFTPRPFAALPGFKVSKEYSYYPKKDEIAQYFESYANKFKLPIASEMNVTKVTKNKTAFNIETNQKSIQAQIIIIATGPYTKAFIPDFAAKLEKDIFQIHSSRYKNPTQIKSNTVTIVGGGNSATQLAEELHAAGKSVTLISSKMPWFLPKTILGISSYWWFYISGALNSDADSKLSRFVRRKGDGIIGLTAKKLIKNNLINHEISRVTDAARQSLLLKNGKEFPVSAVIWATGFKPDYKWLDVDSAVGEKGKPKQTKGISPVNGVYWIGLPWQSRMNSGIINGVGNDAKHIIEHIKSKRNMKGGAMNMENIKAEINNGTAILLDVRTQAEWNDEHASGAVHIPLDRIETDSKSRLNSGLPVYIYCGSGKRASDAKTMLDSKGYTTTNIGGLINWKQAGGETVTENK